MARRDAKSNHPLFSKAKGPGPENPGLSSLPLKERIAAEPVIRRMREIFGAKVVAVYSYSRNNVTGEKHK